MPLSLRAVPGTAGLLGSIQLISREPAPGRLGPCFSVSFGTLGAGHIVYDKLGVHSKQELLSLLEQEGRP